MNDYDILVTMIDDESIQASAGSVVFYDNNSQWFWSVPGTYTGIPWIQTNFGYQTYVSGVVTQGGENSQTSSWVTSIKVSTFSMTTSDQEIFVTDELGNAVVSICRRHIIPRF